MSYKALICDIDGTLIPKLPFATVSEDSKEALRLAQKYLQVSLATARPYEKNRNLFTGLGIVAPCIVSNGAQIVDPTTGIFLKEYPMERQLVERVCRLLEKEQVSFWIQDNGEDRLWREDYIPKKPLIIVVSQLPLQKAQELQHSLTKLSSVAVCKSLPEQNNTADLLITHPLATKQHGVLELCKILGITRDEVIGIGDDYNDISFLSACGLKVAMGNAISEVKDVADFVAPTVGNDGVAAAIEKFVLP